LDNNLAPHIEINDLIPSLSSRRYTVASYSLLAILILFTLLTFRQYGISNDEEVQHVYGRLLLEFYESGFQNQSAFHYKNLYLYGGFFDVIAALIEKANVMWLWDMRHLLSASFGLFGLLAVYKIACTLGTSRTGFIALVLLSLTAAWTGAMFTHTKDIPFATCMTWALYFTIQACRAGPALPLQMSIKVGIAIGCALGMRIGGGFAVVYLIMAMVLSSLVIANQWSDRLVYLLRATLHLLPAALIAFMIMAVFWPWGVMSPSHPSEAIKAFSHFSFNMLTIDDGMVTSIGNVTRTYLLHYLLVKLPEVFLLGLVSIAWFVLTNLSKVRGYFYSKHALILNPLLIAILFPLAFVLITEPALYNGVRHFTFILPPLAVLAALGIDYTLSALQSANIKRIVYSVLCIGLSIPTLVQLIQLHPYEYVFYNHLAGETREAEGQWESDYWSSSLRKASSMLMALPLRAEDEPYSVAVCAESFQGSAYLDDRFIVVKDWESADFYMSSTNMNCDQVLQGEVIGEVTRRDTVLAVVKDRRQLTGRARDATPAPQE
jgi:hypothetical protein